MSSIKSRGKRGGGRAGNAGRRGSSSILQMPWKLITNIDKPTEPLNEEGVKAIHLGAMEILEDIGLEILHVEARDILAKAGCIVVGENVKFDREFIIEMINKAPSEFDITPRNPEKKITVGGKKILFGNVSSPPNYWDTKIRRKVPGNRERCKNLLKLSQYFNCIHFVGGYPVEPVDLHPSTRHLDVLYDKLTITDKAAHAYSLGKERVEDVD